MPRIQKTTPKLDEAALANLPARTAKGLRAVHDITLKMRSLEREVETLGLKRTAEVDALRGHVTIKVIAEAAGVTDQAIYKHQARHAK